MIALSADVYNNGSVDVSALDIEAVDPQGNIADSRTLNETLDIAGSTTLVTVYTSADNFLVKLFIKSNTTMAIQMFGQQIMRLLF